jgi:dGTPase
MSEDSSLKLMEFTDSQSFKIYRDRIIELEHSHFHPKAAFSFAHSRFNGPEEDHRLPYKRDVDRIVHSKAFARYVDKTQVAYLIDNDHVAQRSVHVQLVSNFARGVAEILRLNVDLVEAIALSHDVGHPPFGHEGEGYLSELSEEFGEGTFAHPWQSCRLFTLIEPLNLGLSVYDGILCHDGGLATTELKPAYGKTWEDHHRELDEKKKDPEKDRMPGTLEGCLVKICDTMSYLGRDIEDAISLGIIRREDLPNLILGRSNKDILSFLARDLIRNSYGRDAIAISEEAYKGLLELRRFNFSHIYINPRLKVESEKVKRSYRILFTHLIDDYREKGKKSTLWKFYLHNKPSSYVEDNSDIRLVIDFISGMTDNYFIKMIQRVAIPTPILWELPCTPS